MRVFAARGFQVIRFDNRDVGRSTSFAGAPTERRAPATAWRHGRRRVRRARRQRGRRAHVMGLSMAAYRADDGHRASRTGAVGDVGDVEHRRAGVRAGGTGGLAGPHRRPPADRESAIERHVAGMRVWGGLFDRDEGRWRADAAAAYDRAFTPDGTGRQFFAIGAVRPARRGAAEADRADARDARDGRHADRPERRPPHGRAGPRSPPGADRGDGPRLPAGDLGAVGRPRHGADCAGCGADRSSLNSARALSPTNCAALGRRGTTTPTR